MGANCKQKDYIWIAEDAASPRSACVSLIQQLNDWLANLRRSRQNHIQKHGSKPRSCVFMQSCSNFEFYFGQGNMWSRDVLSWSSEQQLIPDISQTQSAATLAGLGQWRPVKVTWDHIRIPSCRLCHGGRVKIWRKVKGVLAHGAGVRTVTSQWNGCGFDSNLVPLSMEFACSPCVRAGFPLGSPASTNCNNWFLGFNLGALTPKLPLENHSRAWISWKFFPTVSSPKKPPLRTFYVDASASSSPAPVPNSMLTFAFFSQISATRQRGTEISRMDLENLKDNYSPDPRTSNPTLHFCYTECIPILFFVAVLFKSMYQNSLPSVQVLNLPSNLKTSRR